MSCSLSAQCSKWKTCLVLVLMFQTARRIEGYPRASVGDSQDISEMIESAYRNHELLSQNEWLLHNDGGQASSPVESTTLKRLHSQSDEISSELPYTQRKLLTVTSTDMPRYLGRDEIIFPDNRVTTVRPTLVCDNSTFCETVVGYPRQLINHAIAQNASLRFLQSIDPLPVEQRINTDESLLCQYTEKLVYPQAAQDKDNQWLFVVNQENLKQGVRIEVCVNTGRKCDFIDGFSEGYKTTCKQKYIHRELAAVDNDGKIIKSLFPFPSSCCCHVKFIGNPLVRLGLGLQSNRTAAVPKVERRRGGPRTDESESESEES